MSNVTYNLSILCVDGYTIFGLISSDKGMLRNYLKHHDHEGSSVSLVRKDMTADGSVFRTIEDDDIAKELGIE